jgi:hypothetical protein
LGRPPPGPALEKALATDRRDGSSSGFRVEIVHPTAAAGDSVVILNLCHNAIDEV